MRPLSPETLLAVWEAGRRQHELDRALTLLAAASPEISRDELAELPIGERDARLLQLRTLMLGASAPGFAQCPRCEGRVEFSLDTTAFAQPARDAAAARAHEFTMNGSRLRFRLPTSRDLAAAASAPDARVGLERLVERCVVGANGKSAYEKEWSPEFVAVLGQAMSEADSRAEIALTLDCPDCGQHWEMLFDIAAFLWSEIAVRAQRLLREIDTIARAYGWTEREILGLSARRRQSYLEMIEA